ncbi:GlcG/HbpS family heme-binding protein [Bosea sp. NPDC055353]
MTLERAQGLIAAALAAGRVQGARPLAAVVVDAGGYIVASAREDGATIARHEFALAKAWSCIALGLDTCDLVERVEANPAFFSAAATLLSGKLLPAAGGVLIHKDEQILGALGISGDTGEVDNACAIAATGR